MATRRGSEKLLGQHMGHSALNCVKVRAHRKRSVKLREIALNFQSVNSPKKTFQISTGHGGSSAHSCQITWCDHGSSVALQWALDFLVESSSSLVLYGNF